MQAVKELASQLFCKNLIGTLSPVLNGSVDKERNETEEIEIWYNTGLGIHAQHTLLHSSTLWVHTLSCV